MTTRDRHIGGGGGGGGGGGERPQHRRKTPSFSSSLLDAICHSIDESREGRPRRDLGKRDNYNAVEVEEESSSLRRAIMIEKWMENHTKYTRSSRHFNSDSSSSTESSMFSSSETESASRCTPKSSSFIVQKPKQAQTVLSERPQKAFSCETTPKREGRFTRTKSRALKIYGDLKKVKQPLSPGSKIASFLNSIFASRNMKKHHQAAEEWSCSVRKSRSVKDSSSCSFTSRSCLSKAPSPRSKSKRSVRFGPVSVIVGEDCQPRGHKSTYDINDPSVTPLPNISSHFIKQNMNSLQSYQDMKSSKYVLRGSFNQESDNDDDDDDRSCTSSDLFELENIGIVGIGVHTEELPVYGTTSLKINQAIANGLVM